MLKMKGVLFALLAAMAGGQAITAETLWLRAAMLLLCVWAACRFYYFLFYVMERYVGGEKNASIFSMISKAAGQGGHDVSESALASSGNLFSSLPKSSPEEIFETLAAANGVRVERIISTGQASPDDFWYDQPEHEWVAVLCGEAVLEFRENDTFTETRPMRPGDYLFIPAHRQHRVRSTAANEVTVWLAIFFK